MPLSNEKKKQFRKIGHTLNPVVTIGDKGLSETVLAEINRSLDDHELIKIKLRVDDKKQTALAACTKCKAELVQSIGNVILVYRAAEKQNPKLSNILANS